MSSSKNARIYKFLDTHNITETLVSEGAKLIYCHEALYPIIEVQVRLREKSRDQLGDIEKTILAILQTCPASPESVSRLMGVGGGKLYPTIIELEGRGLIEQDRKGIFKLSELGQLSIQYGVEIVDVDRALLLCGITGRLLPRNLYSVQRVTPAELKKRARYLDLVPEENSIKLSALDLSKIHDRRAVNLTDETMNIIGILEYKPAFLWGILVFYRNKSQQETGEVIFPGETIDWLPKEKLREFILEPLGFSARKTPQELLSELEDILTSKGVELSQKISLDQYQNPVVSIKSLNHKILGLYFKNKPFLLYVGSDRNLPVPIGQFPFGGEEGFQRKKNNEYLEDDLLCGRAITFMAASPELKEQVDALRSMDHALEEYYKLPPSKRAKKPVEFIIECLAENGLELNSALDLGKKFGPQNLQRVLNVEDD